MINRIEQEFCGKSRMKVALQFLESYFNSFGLTIQLEWQWSLICLSLASKFLTALLRKMQPIIL